MQKRPGRDDDCTAVGHGDGGAVFHDRADVDHVFSFRVDGAAKETDEGTVSEDALGDGVDEEAGVDEGLAGAFALDGAFGQRFELYAAGGLGDDAAFDFPDEQRGVLNRRLADGFGQPGAGGVLHAFLDLVPISKSLNRHAAPA